MINDSHIQLAIQNLMFLVLFIFEFDMFIILYTMFKLKTLIVMQSCQLKKKEVIIGF